MSLPFRQRIAWVAWTIVLIASLSAVYALNRQAEGRHLVVDDEGGGDTRFGFRLQESAKAMGVDFTHQAATVLAPAGRALRTGSYSSPARSRRAARPRGRSSRSRKRA